MSATIFVLANRSRTKSILRATEDKLHSLKFVIPHHSGICLEKKPLKGRLGVSEIKPAEMQRKKEAL